MVSGTSGGCRGESLTAHRARLAWAKVRRWRLWHQGRPHPAASHGTEESLAWHGGELRHAFAGVGWHVPIPLDRVSRTAEVSCDAVAQVVMPCWPSGRVVLPGDTAHAVSLIAGPGATLALAQAVVLADALANGPEAAYAARLRPWAMAAQRMARRRGRPRITAMPAVAPQRPAPSRRPDRVVPGAGRSYVLLLSLPWIGPSPTRSTTSPRTRGWPCGATAGCGPSVASNSPQQWGATLASTSSDCTGNSGADSAASHRSTDGS